MICFGRDPWTRVYAMFCHKQTRGKTCRNSSICRLRQSKLYFCSSSTSVRNHELPLLNLAY
jgi:hypothetical protein